MEDGVGELSINDIFLRGEFPPPGKSKARRPGDTPTDRYVNAVSALGDAMQAVQAASEALSRVMGDNGRSLVETKGVDQRACAAWRKILSTVEDEVVLWAATHKRANAAAAVARQDEEDAGVADEDADPSAEWDREDEAA